MKIVYVLEQDGDKWTATAIQNPPAFPASNVVGRSNGRTPGEALFNLSQPNFNIEKVALTREAHLRRTDELVAMHFFGWRGDDAIWHGDAPRYSTDPTLLYTLKDKAKSVFESFSYDFLYNHDGFHCTAKARHGSHGFLWNSAPEPNEAICGVLLKSIGIDPDTLEHCPTQGVELKRSGSVWIGGEPSASMLNAIQRESDEWQERAMKAEDTLRILKETINARSGK